MIELIKKIKNQVYHNFTFVKNTDGNIVKHIPNKDYYNWECEMYEYLLRHQKTPISLPMTPSKNCFIYQTNKVIPLYELLNNKKIRSLILNELFSFIFNFKYSNFIHGNLHIYNIFYEMETKQFYIIDLSNSKYYYYTDIKPKYNQHSYSNLLYSFPIEYTDLLSIYSSLIVFYKSDNNMVNYILERVSTYVPINIIEPYNKEFNFIRRQNKLFASQFG